MWRWHMEAINMRLSCPHFIRLQSHHILLLPTVVQHSTSAAESHCYCAILHNTNNHRSRRSQIVQIWINPRSFHVSKRQAECHLSWTQLRDYYFSDDTRRNKICLKIVISVCNITVIFEREKNYHTFNRGCAEKFLWTGIGNLEKMRNRWEKNPRHKSHPNKTHSIIRLQIRAGR